MPQFLTIKQLAELLQVTPRTISRMLARGDLKPLRIGRYVRIPMSEVERLVRG
jgi:excisionase family DNA binding protein